MLSFPYFSPMKVFVPWLSLPIAMAFSATALPLRAIPAVGMNLVRISPNGVQAMPWAQPPPTPKANPVVLVGQAQTPDGEQSTIVAPGTIDYSITFQNPLPINLDGYLSIRRKVSTGDLSQNGTELMQIPFNSANISFSDDRRKLSFRPELRLVPGETICALLPLGPYTLPKRSSPCCFTVVAPVIEPTASPPPPPTPRPFPWWIIPVGLGVGAGICWAAGCFNNPSDSTPNRPPTVSQ